MSSYFVYLSCTRNKYQGRPFREHEDLANASSHFLLKGRMFVAAILLFLSSALADPVQVHLIAHTHNDVGWLKTIDEYYYGANKTIDTSGVQYILDSVVRSLLIDNTKRFTYVEMGFFTRWWNEQTPIIQGYVRELVSNGQLEFVNGGVSMHDEATCYWSDMLDNMATGMKFLNDTFGVQPTIGWQIDPFGHSQANADLYAKMGFDALFFWRMDYQEKLQRLKDKTMEMIWKPAQGTGEPGSIFTHAFFGSYSWPQGFYFDILSDDTPVMDDPRLEDYNLVEKAEEFAAYLRNQTNYYRTNNILCMIGGDYNYQIANYDFKNMDKLINYINNNSTFGLNLFYSTPSTYVKAVNNAGISWPIKTDDFLPYADGPHAYWTGFYTSRPTLKGFARTSGSLLRATENMFAHMLLLGYGGTIPSNIWFSGLADTCEALGIVQHHDAITGTERQAVAYDYARLLSEGGAAADGIWQSALQGILYEATGEGAYMTQCKLLNDTYCPITNHIGNSSLIVTAYNPSIQPLTTIISVPVGQTNLTVIDENNVQQLVDIFGYYAPNPDVSHNKETLHWKATIPALGFRAFKIYENSTVTGQLPEYCGANCILENEIYRLNATLGQEWELSRKNGGWRHDTDVSTTFNVSVGYYVGNSNEGDQQASGAYIFRPNATITETPISYCKPGEIFIWNGNVLDALLQTCDDRAFQYFRLEKGVDNYHLKVYTGINSIPIDDGNGKEIVVTYGTQWNNNGKFATDTNGMNMVPRVWNYRQSFDVDWQNEPSSSNYYPVNSAISFNTTNEVERLTIVNDRANGATVTTYEGKTQIEMMVHRRLLYDDGRGVGQALNETSPFNHSEGLSAEVVHYVLLGNDEKEQKKMEILQNEPYQLFFAFGSQPQFVKNNWDFWNKSPKVLDNFQVSYRPTMYKGSYAVITRVRNTYSPWPMTFDLNDIFVPTYGGNNYVFEEFTLAENQPMADALAKRLVWKMDGEEGEEEWTESHHFKAVPRHTYVFNPGQVRTFMVTFNS